MPITEVFSGIAVADYPAAEGFYERLFGRPPDMRPNEVEGAWQLAGPGWVYVVAEPERAGRSQLTLLVDDLDAELAELRERELELDVEDIPGVVRTARIHDPDGNRITFGQPFAPAPEEDAAQQPADGEEPRDAPPPPQDGSKPADAPESEAAPG